MRCTILIYGTREGWEAMDADAFRALMATHRALQEELEASHELIDATELPLDDAKVVRVRAGAVDVSDGPLARLGQIVAGSYTVECVDVGRAVHIAGRLAEAEFGLVEVRRTTSQPRH